MKRVASLETRLEYPPAQRFEIDTLLSSPAQSTSSEMDDEALIDAGITPGLVRISIGYTGSLEQRWQQFDSALNDIQREAA